MVVHRRYLMLFHQRDQRMEEIAKKPALRAQGGTIGRQTVDHDTLGLERANFLFNVMKMPIKLQLLRRFVPDIHHSSIDFLLKLETNAVGIADYLRRRLVEREHETTLTMASALGDK